MESSPPRATPCLTTPPLHKATFTSGMDGCWTLESGRWAGGSRVHAFTDVAWRDFPTASLPVGNATD